MCDAVRLQKGKVHLRILWFNTWYGVTVVYSQECVLPVSAWLLSGFFPHVACCVLILSYGCDCVWLFTFLCDLTPVLGAPNLLPSVT